ncbi:MAG TPA: RIP metalloprotease RseP [Candidatus Kapabacteria bacterium]|nr:RIP metalloprotease RseP [Candidatus Kapabacteria bacterium]
MYSLMQTVLAFVVTLGVLIFVHEFGHFWVARRCGVRVLRFSIGFGQPLLKWKDSQDTEYVIAALPLGGYVKMLGEPGSEVSEHLKSQSFAHKTVFQRFAIVAAGPLVNLMFAVVLYWLLFLSGITSLAPVVGNVIPGSPAEKAGFQKMEEVVAVDGRATESWDDIVLELVARLGESTAVRFSIKPEGSAVTDERVIQLDNWMAGQEKENPLKLLGLEPFFPTAPPVLGELEKGMAAERQGLQVGDRILAVNDVELLSWDEWVSLIRQNPMVAMNVKVARGEQELILAVTPDAVMDEKLGRIGRIGAKPDPASVKYPEGMLRELQYGPLDAIPRALDYTWSRIALTVSAIGKMAMGKISLDNISGPITIAKVAGDSASYGLEPFLTFVAYLSISLGVLNLLPIPVLDGGHLMYYLVEMVKGSPVSEKAQAFGNSLGLGLLVMFMGLAFYNDLMGL